MSVKASRQRALAALLRTRQVPSQARLLELLRTQGFDATQATVSRDLEELGAMKVRTAEGNLVYALPEEDSAPEVSREQLGRTIAMFMVSAVPAGNLVVLRTPPGHAQAVASAIDRSSLPDVAGTVAGDDTVLVVCSDRTSGKALVRQFRELMGAHNATAPAPEHPPSLYAVDYRGESA